MLKIKLYHKFYLIYIKIIGYALNRYDEDNFYLMYIWDLYSNWYKNEGMT